MSKGKLFVLVGPSGCGKGTVLKLVMEQAKNLFLSVSATTRAPREGDVDGVNYYFKTREEFDQMIAQNAFLEYASYCENSYGTPKAPVFERLSRGENVILEIETNGAKQVKAAYPDAVLLFLQPPSLEELRRRLVGRKTESEEVIEERLQAAKAELPYAAQCDHVVINDVASRAAEEILSILEA